MLDPRFVEVVVKHLTFDVGRSTDCGAINVNMLCRPMLDVELAMFDAYEGSPVPATERCEDVNAVARAPLEADLISRED